MTRILYEPAALRLSIRGHAAAGPKGGDLVCAALSMLMLTLEARCREREEDFLPTLSRAPGEFSIQCRPEEGQEACCRESFDTVAAGLSLLAEREPEHVSVEIDESEEEQA